MFKEKRFPRCSVFVSSKVKGQEAQRGQIRHVEWNNRIVRVSLKKFVGVTSKVVEKATYTYSLLLTRYSKVDTFSSGQFPAPLLEGGPNAHLF